MTKKKQTPSSLSKDWIYDHQQEKELSIDGKKNNGIKANDTLHITGGTYNITAVGDAFNVNDELNITNFDHDHRAKEDGVKGG